MRYWKNTCFRHKPTQAFLVTTALIILAVFYSLYGIDTIQQQQNNTSAMYQDFNQSDRFTQSEAHMSLPEVQKLIHKNYKIKPYQKLIDAMLLQEKKYKDEYCVFYHGMDNAWRLPQDLYTRLYFRFHPLMNYDKDFIFLRFDQNYQSPQVKDFLVSELKNNGLVNDHGAMGAHLLSVNVALFGNVGVPSECTWQYFLKSRGHVNPDRKLYEKIMDAFGLTHNYIQQIMSLANLYSSKEQTILQIFVPKDKVDEIGYLSWIKGIPADADVMDWVLGSVKAKKFPKTQQSIVHLTETFKKEQEKNPLFSNLLHRVQAGDFGLRSFLHTYCNTPGSVLHINDVMARLIFTPSVLLNPASGVKFFRYSMVSPEKLDIYNQRLNEIIGTVIAEKHHFK